MVLDTNGIRVVLVIEASPLTNASSIALRLTTI